MARDYNELRAKMSPVRRRRSEKRARAIITDMMLSELRQLSGMTQRELAQALGVKQPTLSQIESQGDIQVRTLSRIVKALGGELELVARMPSGEVRLRQFVDQAA